MLNTKYSKCKLNPNATHAGFLALRSKPGNDLIENFTRVRPSASKFVHRIFSCLSEFRREAGSQEVAQIADVCQRSPETRNAEKEIRDRHRAAPLGLKSSKHRQINDPHGVSDTLDLQKNITKLRQTPRKMRNNEEAAGLSIHGTLH